MTKNTIVNKNAPILRKTAKAVAIGDISSKKIRDILKRMKTALKREEDGVAIAAPQIGESLRMFVISGRVTSILNPTKDGASKVYPDTVYINPEIIKLSKKRKKVEEGCLSVRWLYGWVERSEKATIRALDENGKKIQIGASGLLAQIFQHETDHLNGILFVDKAENLKNLPPKPKKMVRQAHHKKMSKEIRFVFFGSSQFSKYVLETLKAKGLTPILNITNAKEALPALPEADVYIVASFGKILPKELIYTPKFKTLNIHPSLLPKLRGPAPIQGAILGGEETLGRRPMGETGVTIMRLDEKMDHGPIVAQKKVSFSKWPDKYENIEKTLAQAGAELLAETLPKWLGGKIEEKPQDESRATYTKMIKKEDGLIDFKDSAETNLRKVYAYHLWPEAYFFFDRKDGKKIRVIVRDAEVTNNEIHFLRVIPESKREMSWEEFLRGNK